MPNYCDYSMKVKGTKKNCMEFHDRLRNYDKENHMWRVFDATIYEEKGTDSDYELYITGYCAWSIESCCRSSGYSGGVDLLEVNTRELNLLLEVWTQEIGFGFQEHYIYEEGNCVVDEECNIESFWWDKDEFPTYEEFKAEYEDAPSEEEFEANGTDEVIVGGFEDYGWWSI